MRIAGKLVAGALFIFLLGGCSDIFLRTVISRDVATVIRVGNVAFIRTIPFPFGNATLDDGITFTAALQKLGWAANFGAGGTYGKSISITNETAPIDSGMLSGLDVFFIGYISTGVLGSSEISALDTWVHDNGGILIVTADDSNHADVANHFNCMPTMDALPGVTATATGRSNPIFSGPFGNAFALSKGFATSGYFNSTPSGSTVLATDPSGAAVVLYKYGNGKIVFLSGYNMLSNGNVSPGASVTFPNDKFLCNLFASVFK